MERIIRFSDTVPGTKIFITQGIHWEVFMTKKKSAPFVRLVSVSSLLFFYLFLPIELPAQNIRLEKSRATAEGVLTNALGMKFVLIPAGTFTMGSPSNELMREYDERQHRVTISKSFYMQTTEVTQGQWHEVMGSTPSHFKNCGDNCPVENVSWDDAQKFIRKLNQREGTNKYRLPTEAEWEYACRAGSLTAFANGSITETLCGHDPNLDAMGWYCGNSGEWPQGCCGEPDRRTHPVAQKKTNAWGLYDMHGNVGEWCQDWYGNYPSGHVTDPAGPSSGQYRVLRGGSWRIDAWFSRSAYRGRENPGWRTYILGFRVARTF